MKISNPSTGFRLSKAVLATVDSICVIQDLTRSQLFRRSIIEYLQRQNVPISTSADPPEPQREWFAEWHDGLR